MGLLSIADWVKPHLYEGKNFHELSSQELTQIQNGLKRFQEPDPEVSIVIPAWNEENNIYRTLSSLAASTSKRRTEIIVINNNSSDNTQQVLTTLGVKNYIQEKQGTPYARQMGLDKAGGRYHLCADSDTFYPPDWIDLMVAPMATDSTIKGVYGTYSFIPPQGQNRAGLLIYEFFTRGVIILRKRKREFMNVYGFNMGFVTETGREVGGFKVNGERVYANVVGSDFSNEAEDGRMALNLTTRGKLSWVTNPRARVYTSSRRLMDDGSIGKAFMNRVKRQAGSLLGRK